MTDLVPGEFRYWANLDRPAVRAALRACRAVGFEPTLPDDVVRAFASMYYDADPLAEAFVEEVRPGRARQLLDQALASGVASIPDAPATLVALFADVDRDPVWLDRAAVARGARAFRRFGPALFRFAGAVTLASYAECSVAKPLALSGAYAGASTRQRFLETVAFWIAVSEPGALAHGAAGRASALRVRLMHVMVRKRLYGHPEWNTAAWGAPISQADALLTLMGGSVAPGLLMHAMGFLTSKADIEALLHFWRYVGHLMGVQPRWYPATVADGVRLLLLAMIKGAHRSGDDGKALCHSYAEAFRPDPELRGLARVRAAITDRVHRGYTQFFLPPSVYRANALPSAGPWALVPLLQAPAILGAEALRRTVGLDDAADGYARWRRDRWLAHHAAGRAAQFRPPPTLTR